MSWKSLGATVGVVAVVATLGCGSGSTKGFSEKPAPTPAGRIEQLAGMFEFQKDGETGEGWYAVKDPIAGVNVRKRIEPFVHSSGRIVLRSIYRDEDWIYHDRVIVTVGGREYASERIPITDRRNSRRVIQKEELEKRNSRTNRRVAQKQFIGEQILFTNGSDNGILAAIARDSSQPIEVQFVGRDLVHRQIMSDDDKKRIAAGVELARLLRERQGSKP